MIREELQVSLSQITGQLQQLRQQSQEADTRAQTAQARVDRLVQRLQAAEVRANTFDRQVASAERRVLKTVGKAALVEIGGEILSEIGIPEAAAPIMRIGTATLQGAMQGGLPVAVAAAALSLAREGIAGIRREAQAREALEAHQLARFEQIQERFREIDRIDMDREKAAQALQAKLKEKADREVSERAYQAARAQALGLYN